MRGHALTVACIVVFAACGSGEAGSAPTTTESSDSTTSSGAQASTSTASLPTSVPTSVPESTTTTESADVAPEPEARFSASGLFEAIPGVAIPNGADGAWDWQYTDPGAVASIDGTMHAFQNGFIGWPSEVGVGYWTSADGGMTWTEVSEDPVFEGNDLDYVGVAALASSVIRDDDGTWILYFYSWDQGTWPVSTSIIGRATAPDPSGPWTADPEPVLSAGSEGEWDELAVRSPSVVKVGDEYRMYFAGTTRDVSQIGLATSSDGITWTKYDDPTTTDPPFAESDPILTPATPSGGNWWDLRNVYIPNVVQTDDGFVMLYSSSNTVTDPTTLQRKVGLAVSDDGLEWTRSRTAIINATAFDGQAIYFSELVADDDGYLVLLEIGKGNETEVYAARYDGDLPPG